MPNPQIRMIDAKILLPKKRASIRDENVEAAAFKSKKVDVCIEDFLEKLNGEAGKVEDNEVFIQSPDIFLGDNLSLALDIFKDADSVWFGVRTFLGSQFKEMDIILRKLKVEGVCGGCPVKGESECDLP